MTKTEIIDDIMDRLNLTSTTASTRLGKLVNRYYLRITTAIGVSGTSRRVFDVEGNTVIASPEVTFDGVEKLTRVYFLTDGVKQFLDEVTIDELRDLDLESGDAPARYAVKEVGSNYAIIYLDFIAESIYTLFADGYGNATTLGVGDSPIFPESFHDILIEGPLMDEYKKLEKTDLSKESRGVYEQRLSDLRMWAAKNGYLKLQQNGRPRGHKFRRDSSGVPF
jgi:hypothetical protein